ncbi:hypothetical protein V8J88_21285 [Massilia sp. W12]|uniref:hypothetical protein n=1 Tax=Massilia sp. W12 TaxID=3126507 RepID=UPI0030D0A32F
MKPLSINEALDQLDQLAGRDISLLGIFCFEFEDVSLYHHPKGVRRPGYSSSIWLSTGTGSIGFDSRACERLHGKLVLVEGTLIKPDPYFGGCGHMSLWPAEIIGRSLQRPVS